jgi:small subunit ribosomal protein S6
MPLYELLCLAKPALAKPELFAILKGLGEVVYKHEGVITDLKSYGDQGLAYDIRRPFECYASAHIWQMDFMSPTLALQDLNHELHVNEKVLRWVIVKRPRFKTPLSELVAQVMLEQPPRSGPSSQASS